MTGKLLRNSKGHMDPLCESFPITATILSIVYIFMSDAPSKLSSFEHYMIVFFLIVVFFGVINRILRHGFTPYSAIPILFLLICALFMMRFVFGVPSPYDAFLVRNMKTIMPVLTAFIWAMTHLP